MKQFILGAVVGIVFGALFCRRNSPIVEKVVSIVKALYAWIKSKVKKKG